MNRLDHESFYQSNIERLLHLNPDDCKNEILRLNLTKNKNTDGKIVNFQVFADSVHQAELERYQGHIKLDEKYPYNGAHGRLTYDIHDKHWIPHIGINDPSNCKADTKIKGYQEIMFLHVITKYHETEFACKYSNPLYKTQYSEILVEYEKSFDMTTGKIKFDPYVTSHPINEGTSYVPVNFHKSKSQPGGKLKPYDSKSTRLQELSLMSSTYFGNIHYDIHLDMKLDYPF